MTVIDEYLNKLEAPEKAVLQKIRELIHQIIPEAKEVRTYGMPGFKYKKKYLISFAAFRDHLSIFPGSEVIQTLKPKLADYKTSKGTIQFTLDHPLPKEIIIEILHIRKEDIDQKTS